MLALFAALVYHYCTHQIKFWVYLHTACSSSRAFSILLRSVSSVSVLRSSSRFRCSRKETICYCKHNEIVCRYSSNSTLTKTSILGALMQISIGLTSECMKLATPFKSTSLIQMRPEFTTFRKASLLHYRIQTKFICKCIFMFSFVVRHTRNAQLTLFHNYFLKIQCFQRNHCFLPFDQKLTWLQNDSLQRQNYTLQLWLLCKYK